MKSATVERGLGNTGEERRLLDEGLRRFPSFFKLYLMLGQLEERLDHSDEGKDAYELGLKHCPNCITLWLSLAGLEEKTKGMSKARSVLTIARKKNPRNPEFWLAEIKAECRHGQRKEADNLMSKAMQECPNSGILWAAKIEMAPLHDQKKTSQDALKNCDKDPHVYAAVARIFWLDGKAEKVRFWLNKAVTCAPDIGDFWSFYCMLELRYGSEDTRKELIERCVAAEPKHGKKWQSVAKALENSSPANRSNFEEGSGRTW